MELKLVLVFARRYFFTLLIVPYGIETSEIGRKAAHVSRF